VTRSETEGPAVSPVRRPVARPGLSVWVGVVAAAQLALLIATSTRYGYHRDELYFIVAGSHPAFGYPDQPPLVPLLCWALHELAPGSLLVLRLPSALAAAATTVLVAFVARELGGGSRAQLIAACCAASSGFALAIGHFVTTTTFDLLSTSALGWLMIRAVMRRSPASLLAAGMVVGIGCESKPQVVVVAIVILAMLAITGPRWPFRSWWLAGGIAAAALLAAPYVIWQARHGWPQVTVAGNIGGSAEGGRTGFFPFQFLLVSPVLAPVWIAGLIVPFRRASLRFLPLTYAVLAVVYLVGNGNAYYLASLYPALVGLGSLPVADWTMRSRRARLRTAVLPDRRQLGGPLAASHPLRLSATLLGVGMGFGSIRPGDSGRAEWGGASLR
jgi:4-amino-4-deoxy-L-arabinose transferase-like glycosyltransferase